MSTEKKNIQVKVNSGRKIVEGFEHSSYNALVNSIKALDPSLKDVTFDIQNNGNPVTDMSAEVPDYSFITMTTKIKGN